MRVIDSKEELGVLLHGTSGTDEDWNQVSGKDKPAWVELPEWTRDDYRAQAGRLMELLRIAVKLQLLGERP